MSPIPVLFRDWWDDAWDVPLRSLRIMDQHLETEEDDLFGAVTAGPRKIYRRKGYYRPWRTVRSYQDASSIGNKDTERFQVNLDVQQFAPDEISVKTVDDTVVVEGKHEEKEDQHGYVARHFVRRYKLPNGHEAEDVTSSLSTDGVLTITAPKKSLTPETNERIVSITHTDELPLDEKTGGDRDQKEK